MKHFYSNWMTWLHTVFLFYEERTLPKERSTETVFFFATFQKLRLTLQIHTKVCMKPQFTGADSFTVSLVFPQGAFPMQGGRQARVRFSPAELNLPVPRLVLLVLRGLALGCVDEPVLGVVLAVFLVPEAPSLCLGVAAVPLAALDEAGRVELCSFLAWPSRGRAWFVRATGLVSRLSEQIKRSRERKVQHWEVNNLRFQTKMLLWGAHLRERSTRWHADEHRETQEILKD